MSQIEDASRTFVGRAIRESRRSQWLKKFQTNEHVKGLRPPKAALRALDMLICLEQTLAIAIDGAKRPTK